MNTQSFHFFSFLTLGGINGAKTKSAFMNILTSADDRENDRLLPSESGSSFD
jgi:hypothetical protein